MAENEIASASVVLELDDSKFKKSINTLQSRISKQVADAAKNNLKLQASFNRVAQGVDQFGRRTEQFSKSILAISTAIAGLSIKKFFDSGINPRLANQFKEVYKSIDASRARIGQYILQSNIFGRSALDWFKKIDSILKNITQEGVQKFINGLSKVLVILTSISLVAKGIKLASDFGKLITDLNKFGSELNRSLSISSAAGSAIGSTVGTRSAIAGGTAVAAVGGLKNTIPSFMAGISGDPRRVSQLMLEQQLKKPPIPIPLALGVAPSRKLLGGASALPPPLPTPAVVGPPPVPFSAKVPPQLLQNIIAVAVAFLTVSKAIQQASKALNELSKEFGFLKKTLDLFKEVGGVFGYLNQALDQFIEIASDFGASLIGAFTNQINTIIDGIKLAFGQLSWEEFKNNIQAGFDAAVNNLKNAWKRASGTLVAEENIAGLSDAEKAEIKRQAQQKAFETPRKPKMPFEITILEDLTKDFAGALKELLQEATNKIKEIESNISSINKEREDIIKNIQQNNLDYFMGMKDILSENLTLNKTGQGISIMDLGRDFTQSQSEINKMRQDQEKRMEDLSAQSFETLKELKTELVKNNELKKEQIDIERNYATRQSKLLENLELLKPTVF